MPEVTAKHRHSPTVEFHVNPGAFIKSQHQILFVSPVESICFLSRQPVDKVLRGGL
jgi:hypothetical protein